MKIFKASFLLLVSHFMSLGLSANFILVFDNSNSPYTCMLEFFKVNFLPYFVKNPCDLRFPKGYSYIYSYENGSFEVPLQAPLFLKISILYKEILIKKYYSLILDTNSIATYLKSVIEENKNLSEVKIDIISLEDKKNLVLIPLTQLDNLTQTELDGLNSNDENQIPDFLNNFPHNKFESYFDTSPNDFLIPPDKP